MPGWQGANEEAHWACVTEEQPRQPEHPGRRSLYESLLQSTSLPRRVLLGVPRPARDVLSLSKGRCLAGLGATRDFHHGLLDAVVTARVSIVGFRRVGFKPESLGVHSSRGAIQGR